MDYYLRGRTSQKDIRELSDILRNLGIFDIDSPRFRNPNGVESKFGNFQYLDPEHPEADKSTGSYITTYYFVFLWIPVFPIARYKVILEGGGYRFIGKRPLRTFDKIHLLVALALLLWFIIYMANLMSS